MRGARVDLTLSKPRGALENESGNGYNLVVRSSLWSVFRISSLDKKKAEPVEFVQLYKKSFKVAVLTLLGKQS